MDRDAIFSKVQKMLTDVPMILIGTGATIPMDIPSMPALAEHLMKTLNSKYKTCSVWQQISERLANKVDLESALTDVNLGKELADDIVTMTWELISEADLALFKRARTDDKLRSFAKLIKKFYDTSAKCVNIVTTNYDRAIEYACDLINVKVETKYRGSYIRTFSNAPLKFKEVVNLLKVHGSLDLFSDKDGAVFAIPLMQTVPLGLLPVIVPPGGAKYEVVLTGASYRSILHETDTIINSANSYLCYGFGFNDTHIQAQIIEGIKAGKAITVATKYASDKTVSLLSNNSKNFLIIERYCQCIDYTKECQCGDFTKFTINGDVYCLDGTYWTMDGLLEII